MLPPPAWIHPLLDAPTPGFDPVKDVPITVVSGVLTVQVPAGVHLKRRFFKVELVEGPGTLTVGPLPPGDGQDDAGDPVWHGTLRVSVTGQGLPDPARLKVTYQPCTEGPDSVCFVPQHRLLAVPAAEIPAARP